MSASSSSEQRTLRIMTYNVHSCIGMDGKMSPRRIARVIAQYRPDVVALQELDAERPRTGSVDQAHLIAQELDMHFHFHPVMTMEDEKYGNAILSLHPFTLVRSEELPRLSGWRSIEPRGAMWIRLELGGQEFNIINTHMGLHRRERVLQAEALLGSAWLNHPECRENRILLGDFNASPKSETCRIFGSLLSDCQQNGSGRPVQSTWFGRMPLRRIDHIFHEEGLEVQAIMVPSNDLVRVASDHLPLIADFKWT
ncbi:MAG: endonuclease [Candidatus Hydrogenedentota bacterium]|nr:MAG: endonuclease [Candidatus Hydrogenedentota bacterium]